MRAINHTAVVKGYVNFSLCMALVVVVFLFMSYCFISTMKFEASKVEMRSVVFDRTFASQVNVVDRVDSLYNYMLLINSSYRINDIMVQNVVSTRKMQLLNDLEGMDEKDVLLYKRLVTNVNRFLTVKDSIRILKKQEETLREDLKRCITSEHQAARKLSLEGAQANKTSGNGK